MMAKVGDTILVHLLERCNGEDSAPVEVMSYTLEDIVKELQDYRKRDPEPSAWLMNDEEREAKRKHKRDNFNWPDDILEDGHCITCGMRYYEG